MTIQQIEKITGLTKEEIEELKQDVINHEVFKGVF